MEIPKIPQTLGPLILEIRQTFANTKLQTQARGYRLKIRLGVNFERNCWTKPTKLQENANNQWLTQMMTD